MNRKERREDAKIACQRFLCVLCAFSATSAVKKTDLQRKGNEDKSNSMAQSGNNRIALLLLVLICFMAGACGGSSAPSESTTPSLLPSLQEDIERARTDLSPRALQYLEDALDTIQTHHAVGPTYDWEEWRLAVLEHARDAETASDSYDAIQFALADLPGGHISFQEPHPPDSLQQSAAPIRLERVATSYDQLHVGLIRDRIGHVVLPSFLHTDTQSANAFAAEVQHHISEADPHVSCGWIVDLRRNGGGNMWPMIAGVGPILGKGLVGLVAGREGPGSPWYYRNGEARLDTLVLASVANPYTPRDPQPAIAVLIGHQTGSSGEAVAVAFQGRNKTKFFGTPTAGATSSPVFFTLSDDVEIGFAGSFFADRNGTVYRAPIEPDVRVDGAFWDEPDRVVEAAVEWLLEQPNCP